MRGSGASGRFKPDQGDQNPLWPCGVEAEPVLYSKAKKKRGKMRRKREEGEGKGKERKENLKKGYMSQSHRDDGNTENPNV